MQPEFIDREDAARAVTRELAQERSIALDCEAAGFHRYSDRLCLVQMSSPEGRDVVFDPLAVDLGPILAEMLENPDQILIMHGGDYDIRLMDRDLGIRPRGIWDTQAAAALLGESGLGLASLLERHLGVRLSKKYQRADWARRPLSSEMLSYAASDTRHLHELADLLRNRLEEVERIAWAHEEFSLLEEIRHQAEAPGDPVLRVKAARGMSRREIARLRAALEWRDDLARARDRAPFRIAPDSALVAIAQENPGSRNELHKIKGLNGRMVDQSGPDLLERLEAVNRMPEAKLDGLPSPERNGPGRPPPEVEALANRLKTVRNQMADALSLDRGVVLPNALILEVAQTQPSTLEELGRSTGLKRWQVETMGEALLEALKS